MILDIALVLIILFFAFFGFRKGFFYGLPRFAGLILSVVAAYFLFDPVANFLKEKTGIYDFIYELIYKNVSSFINSYAGGNPSGVPSALTNAITDTAKKAAETGAEKIAETVFNIIVFLLIFVIIKILFMLLCNMFSKKTNDGFIGGFDGVLGLLLGAVKGVILVFIIVIVILPLSFIISPDVYSWVTEQMGSSFLANFFIDYNPLTNLIPSFNLEDILPSTYQPVGEDNGIDKDIANLV
jgi:uncharacterized membrane protein required for colicin V production